MVLTQSIMFTMLTEVSDVVISITLRPVKVLMLLKLEVLVVA